MHKNKEQWLLEARMYLDEDYTQHLYKRALETDDVNKIVFLLRKAKSIWAASISEADQLINKTPK